MSGKTALSANRASMRQMGICIAALAAGSLIGRAYLSGAAGVNDSANAVHRQEDKEKTVPVWKAKDFIDHLNERAVQARDPEHSRLQGILKDWSDKEVRAALDDALREPEMILEAGSGILGAIFDEYLRRGFDSGLAWFEGLDMRRKRALQGYLQERWPVERAEEGLTFLSKNRDLFTRVSSPYSIPAKCLTGASAKGAQATAEIIGPMDREQAFPYFSGILDLEAGFDFTALLAADQMKSSHPGFTGLILTSWFQQDKQAAFDWVLANQGPGFLLPFRFTRTYLTPKSEIRQSRYHKKWKQFPPLRSPACMPESARSDAQLLDWSSYTRQRNLVDEPSLTWGRAPTTL